MRFRRLGALASMLILFAGFVKAGEDTGEEVLDAVRLFRSQHEVEILRELTEFVTLPNSATDLEDMEVNAKHLTGLLEARRFEVKLLRAEGGPPVVYGQRLSNEAKLTVVFYAHYDGQAVVPELWSSDPFEVVVRTGRLEAGGEDVPFDDLKAPINPEWRLYGRSTSDDKVSIIALLTALDALDAAGIEPGINIKLLLDGEEERSSPHIPEVLRSHIDLLAADLWVFCDGPMHQTRLPQVVYGVRGVTSVHVTAYGPSVGLHSGHYGNWAPDPGMALARLITSMRDADGNLLIDGIDELVRPLGPTAAAAIENSPAVDEKLKQELALGWTEGQPAPLAERITRPAVNLLGFSVGQVGAKAKNAIPPQAKAVVGFRLVPNVTPEAVRAATERHIRSQGFHIVHDEPNEASRREHTRVVWLEWKMGYPALATDMDMPISKAIAQIVDEAVDGPIVLTPSLGGSLPLYVFSEILDAPPIVVVPIANHDNNQHAPNENLRIKNLWLGIEIYAALMARL
ncbi:MAG: M20/M25/M40 family metallo-hydrolase [Acidobacteriota bacterium]|nr:M20/M25/M40 family metallo-hydrolase [Acidobacteriota bacterium]